jgi:hypothetical protein
LVDEVAAAISEQSIDLSLFTKKEDAETVTWELPEAMLNDGLVDFLRDQFLLTRTTLADEQATLLAKLTAAGTWERMLGIIEEDGGWVLHRGRFKEHFTVGKWRFGISVWLDLNVYVVEGKAMLECYANLFRYMEKSIARQRTRYPLAAAVKVCIG